MHPPPSASFADPHRAASAFVNTFRIVVLAPTCCALRTVGLALITVALRLRLLGDLRQDNGAVLAKGRVGIVGEDGKGTGEQHCNAGETKLAECLHWNLPRMDF